MTSKQKAARQRGARFEIDLLNALREVGLDAERLRLAGVDDEGDLVVREGSGGEVLYTVIEAKAEKEMNFSGYVAEAQKEREHFIRRRGLNPSFVDGIAVVKRPGKSILDAYVVTTVRDYFILEADS
ncbi:hypothetical protein [Puerhibacterium puerhi]|uniref:hypothetical protein n=1 Tax=Puerhibacterium puerhi TaxID=2692623 RepID=UPI00135CE039|nr:hypothetical protein [Puerhibacterium puerhi]